MLNQRTALKNARIPLGASSLLEVLFVLIVAIAFGIGLYREFSTVSIEKNITQFNDQFSFVVKIANLFYFSVDPTTVKKSHPIRFCNQTPTSTNKAFAFNQTYQLNDVYNLVCPATKGTGRNHACDQLNTLITKLNTQATAAKEQYLISLGQDSTTSPKFVAVILEDTALGTQAKQTILNKDLFNLFKGKLVGNPRYIEAGNRPFSSAADKLTGNSIVWLIAPSQGELGLFTGESLANVNIAAFNNLENQWDVKSPSDNFALGCVNTYVAPGTT